MNRAQLAVLTLLVSFAGQSVMARDAIEPASALINVNDRYTVESIDFTTSRIPRVSQSTLTMFKRLIGDKLNLAALNRLCAQIGGELHASQVTFHLARGSQPDQVRVLLDVEQPKIRFDAEVPRFVYVSEQGWSGVGEARVRFGASTLSVAVLSDVDDSVERFSGVRTGYQFEPGGSERIRLGFTFDAFQNSYDPATQSAASQDGAELYRSRTDFEPSVTFLLAEPLTLTLGYDAEQLRPAVASGEDQLVSAATVNLRYRKQWNGLLEVSYAMRFASHSLGSGYSFVRNEIRGRYQWKRDRQSIEAAVLAGTISGNAPVLDRFVLGTSTTLRGWNRYDIDPLGGNRVAHASVTYGYRHLRVFYDAGSIWSAGETPEFRESAGAGYQKDRFLLAVAFPFRTGRIEPVLIAGMNF